MKLYNTLTRQIEEILPLYPPKVGIYTCGPTVYDYAHIGHWFNYVRMDILIRTLTASGLEPDWIMNITDVGHLVSDADDGEDKLQKGARREGKTAWEVAEFYTIDFLKGMNELNISQPRKIVKATDHIVDQIELIKQLELKGYTYLINDDGLYFDTSLFPGYQDFAKLDLDDQQITNRMNKNPGKRQSADFALWKLSTSSIKQRDMEWESPWGKGFPGWHIECSAMSLRYLGPTIDIHTGGIDHIAVHHTNEIAQSEAVTGKRFAQYWMHSNHLMVDGKKISKSLGNGITLKDVSDHQISFQAVRMHVLESHYRNQSRFSWNSLQAAQNRLRDLRAMAALRWQIQETTSDAATFALEDVPLQLAEYMQNDLNSPQALAYLNSVSTQLQVVLLEKDMADHFNNMLSSIDQLLGLQLLDEPDLNDQQKELIKRREVARTDNNWVMADKLRTELLMQGINLRDTSSGVIWARL